MTPDPQLPIRTLVIAPPDLARLLHHLSIFPSLAASGRQLILLARDADAAVLEPTLLQLRLRHTGDHLAAPLALDRDEHARIPVLRRLRCDEAVLLEPSWDDSQLAAAAGIRRRWGYAGGPASMWLRPAVTRPPLDERHAGEDLRELAEAMGATWRPTHRLEVTQGWRDLGQRRLREAKLQLDQRPILGVYPGRQGKPWPLERFEELLRQVRQRMPSCQIVLLATDAELWQGVLLYEKTGKIHPVIGPDLPPDGIAALLHELDLVVAADSWPLHLAAALGTATVGLFERPARRWAPAGIEHRQLERRPLARIEVGAVVDEVCAALPPISTVRE